MNDNDNTVHLVLFCRRPAIGEGKQRLARELGPQLACEAGEHLLATALEDAAAWPGPVTIAPAEPADTDWASELLERDCRVIAQPAGNLGQRLNHVDRVLRKTGAQRIVYIGSDAPGLDAGYFEAARAALKTADAVLGPALDGGVTLMGASRPWPELSELPWSTERLGGGLTALCEAAGWHIVTLEASADVDLPVDLDHVVRALAADPRPARRQLRNWWQSRTPHQQDAE